ncbi:hypothetical protein FHS29_004949 [Saccharothrix tamanrassetensis]|uniref:Uncharacterized protein n=1 Tax=Saccharothrix tamanrassetensis TaxID=1051531 RepID=A0A841CLB8_9PSEU|nr:hypothetical protein [Saccharothrix tamanrassetensis]MBB5958341.1 hypothetical protein [Saccharothrix tamanrassetensis]
MLDRFLSFLDDYLVDRGVTGLLKAAIGILAFGSVLSVAFGSLAVKAACLTIAALFVAGTMTILARNQLRLRGKMNRQVAMFNHYQALIYRELGPLWRIDRWEEDVEVASNGDATASILVHFFVERDRMPFCMIRLGSKWDQPLSSKRKVQVVARNIESDGSGGTRVDETQRWLPDGRLEVLTHFRSAPPKKGQQVCLRFDVVWPQKVAPLMRFRQPDEFLISMLNPLTFLSYRVTLPAGTAVRASPVGLQAGVDDYRLKMSTTGGNRPVAELTAQDIAADRKFGMRLDLE